MLTTNTLTALATRFRLLDRENYEAVLKTLESPLEDLNLMPLVFQRIRLLYPLDSEHTPEILSIVFQLFAPYKHLSYNNVVRLRNGLRKAVCKEMNWESKTMLNYWSVISPSYMLNPRFAEKIATQADEILDYIQQLEK